MTLEKAEAELVAAKERWRLVAKKAGLARGRAEQIRQAKASRVLAAATGDTAAAEKLDTANRSLMKATLEVEDLEAGLQQAAALVETAERQVAVLQNAALANRIEAAAVRFAAASATADAAMAALAQALVARDAIAQELLKLAPPGQGAELSHRMQSPGPLIRAARAAGLGRMLRLPFVEKHHEAPLAAARFPELDALVERLRGNGSLADRRAA